MLDVEWSQNNTILIQNAVEISSTPSNIALESYNGVKFDASRIGLEYDINGNGAPDYDTLNNNDQLGVGRRRRSIQDKQNARNGRRYNAYLQRIIEGDDFTDALSGHVIRKRALFDSHEHVLNNLPLNRTIFFDCTNAEEGTCVQAKFTVYNFRTGNSPILISFNFSIDLNDIGKK